MSGTTPRIYVADLAAYNAGHLHGKWLDLDADTTVEELHQQVQAILNEGTRLYRRETLSIHEEWAIHDYEGFGPIRVEEYTSLESVVGHVQRMGEESRKYFAWVEARGVSDGDNFDPDMVSGPYESVSDYFDQYLENVYGDVDVETVLVKAGVDARAAEGLSGLLTWIDADQFVRDSGNPLVAIRTGEYGVEFYEVLE